MEGAHRSGARARRERGQGGPPSTGAEAAGRPPRVAMKTRRVESLAEFETLRSAWAAVVRESGQTSPFLSHEWFTCCWRGAGAARRPEAILVEDRTGRPGATHTLEGQPASAAGALRGHAGFTGYAVRGLAHGGPTRARGRCGARRADAAPRLGRLGALRPSGRLAHPEGARERPPGTVPLAPAAGAAVSVRGRER